MKRGQAAIESLFIFLVILSSAIFITSLYLQTNTETTIYSIARNELVNQANAKDSMILIQKLSFDNQTKIISVQTTPTTLNDDDFDLSEIELQVLSATNTDIDIKIN